MDVERVRTWIARDPDPDTRAELEALLERDDRPELERRFQGRLAFGTAGLRGLLGAGPARMNRLVVRETTTGLARYLLERIRDAPARGVVVGYDARRGSRDFARDAAAVLAAMGMRVHLTATEQPTPLCAFAVKELSAAAGIVITASHNPAEYNGYKVYWQNGAQIIPPHDTGISREIERAAGEPVPWIEPGRAMEEGRIVPLGAEIETAYLRGLRRISLAKASAPAEPTIAYTPLHGVATRLAQAAFEQAGFRRVHVCSDQREPDPDFPTVRFPNPEEPGAMDLVLDLARKEQAQLVLANDPDADRLAVAIRTGENDYRRLTGNEVGVLLGDYILRETTGSVLVGTTIVSSRLLSRLAEERGARYFETLTGFKWVMNVGLEIARKERARFVFGYEEALGYAIGTHVFDKDGISAMIVFAELVAEHLGRGRTVLDRLEEIYRRHGLHLTMQRSLRVGPESTLPSLGDRLRERPPETIAGVAIETVVDVSTGERRTRGRTTPVELPKSDVLVYELVDGTRVIVRPSGTEPKIKCYYEMRQPMPSDEGLAAAEARVGERLSRFVAEHQDELRGLER